MIWRWLLGIYLILAPISFLVRRTLGKTAPQYNRFVNWFFFLGVLYPVGLLAAFVTRGSLHTTWHDLGLLAVCELVFPLINIAAYRASKDIGAGLFTIINNLAPIITITTASLWLHEGLNNREIVGAALVVVAAVAITVPSAVRSSRAEVAGFALAFVSVCLLGVGTTFERYMLTRMSFSAYLVYGWGAQALWMTILAWPERKHIKLLRRRATFRGLVVVYSFTNALKGLCWVGALYLSGNASMVSVFGGFTAVLVVMVAYFVLQERDYTTLKLASALAGIVGLAVLNF